MHVCKLAVYNYHVRCLPYQIHVPMLQRDRHCILSYGLNYVQAELGGHSYLPGLKVMDILSNKMVHRSKFSPLFFK